MTTPALALRGACLLTLGLLAGCQSKDADSYFPTPVGAAWHYQLKTAILKPPVEDRLDLSIDRAVSFTGRDTVVHRSASGVEYYLQSDAQGWQRVASRLDTEERATLDAQAQTVLPHALSIGSQWSAPTVPYVLRRMAEFPHELKYRARAVMRYEVRALDDSLDVPAGHFDHCARVEGHASVHLFVDPIKGFADVPLVSTEWYCRGVGLVRFDREEYVESSFLSGGAISYQLTGYAL